MDTADNKQILFLPSTSEDKFTDLDFLFSCATEISPSSRVTLNLERAGFITPSRAVVLVLACRYINSITHTKVFLRNISRDVQKYLLRMDLPVGAHEWLEIDNLGDDEWGRNPHTSQLLEMTKIGSTQDVEHVIARSENIFGHWLDKSALNSLLNSLSELCSNVYQHSADADGVVLIQKYEKQSLNVVNVQVAVGDLA